MQEQYFTKNDWLLFRNKSVKWQENYMEKLCQEYVELLSQDVNPAKKFWALTDRIKLDKSSPGVILEMRKSKLIYNIVALINNEVISFEDLQDFSNELQERVKNIVMRNF